MNNHFSKANKLLAVAMIFGSLTSVANAESISGTVINKSSNKPAAGDDVVLIRLTRGMQESARTKTNSHGHYTLDVPEKGFHLLRVTHDKANYFKPMQPGMKTVDIDVYSSATKVKGVTGEADVMRIQTDESGTTLRVTEVFFLKNNSSPPMTQFGPRPFEFYLPEGAVIQGSAALAPGGMAVQADPVPLDGQNHYAFIFPIRPGETRFQVSYTLTYSGSLHLAPKPILPTDVVAIIIPKSISFRAGQSAPYNAIQDDLNLQTFVARNVLSSQSLDFTISGAGQLPPETQTPTGGDQQPNSMADTSGAVTSDTRPGGGLGNPIDPAGTNDPWAKYRWWIMGGLGLALTAGAGLMLRQPAKGDLTPASEAPHFSSISLPTILMVLKEEFFLLETEHLQGQINESEYGDHKAALEQILKRVMSRKASNVESA